MRAVLGVRNATLALASARLKNKGLAFHCLEFLAQAGDMGFHGVYRPEVEYQDVVFLMVYCIIQFGLQLDDARPI